MRFGLKSLFCLLIVCFTSIATFAQLEPFLLLEKPGKGKRIRYFIGDEIEFKKWDEKDFYKGTIVQFTDSSFYVDKMVEIKLREVEALADRSSVEGVRKITNKSFLVIPAIFLFSIADNTFNTGNNPVVSEEVYPVSAFFAGIGLLGLLYKGKRYRLKNKWRIIMVRH